MESIALKNIKNGRDRLILHPLDPFALSNSKTKLDALLNACQFTSKNSSGELVPGPAFMRLLTFVGCSPSVAGADDHGEYNQYSITIETASEPVIIASTKIKSPECIVCHEKDRASRAVECIIQESDTIYWVCPACNERIELGDINWRNKLAVASSWIQVNGVFEGESLPSDKFLDLLKSETGTEWSYCYC